MPDTKARYLVKRLYRRGSSGVLYGPSGAGIALDLAYCIARGQPFNRRRVRQGSVVYCALEGGHGVKKRVAVLAQEFPPTETVPMTIVPDTMDLRHPRDRAELVALIQATRA